jgi:hypothetical protein
MFLLVALAASAPVTITQGWPCQRLNWAWRIVWTTCSINVFIPGTSNETPANIPSGIRTVGPAGNSLGYVFNQLAAPNLPLAQSQTLQVIPTTGVTFGTFFEADAVPAPQILCQNAPNTGAGVGATVRNRCRRALDSYGQLVKSCGLATGTPGALRGPNNLNPPDYLPTPQLQPHVSNMQALQLNARFCNLPVGTVGSMPNIFPGGPQFGPAYVCPGLMGWFNVVLNACGFTNNPNLNWPNLATPLAANNNFPNIFPTSAGSVGGGFQTLPQVTTPTTGGVGDTAASGPNYAFCAASAANAMNAKGTTFKTSRCRKALDQFGRTAGRCNASPIGGAAGPNQAGGYSDPLRLWAIGHQTPLSTGLMPLAPDGADAWAPNCNV